MRKHHPKNERMKRRYLAYLEEAKRMSTKSTDQVAAAIAQFEASTNYRDFARFHVEQARRFKRQLDEQTNPKTGKPLAKATIRSRLLALKSFFQWLADQPGYRKGIRYADAEYFNPSANDSRVATARRERPAPTLDEVRRVLFGMGTATAIEKRDRALIAFAILTGIRDDAMASLSLRHVDLARRTVFQDARSVRTKNRKTMTTWFFPVGSDIEAIVTEWISYLTAEHAFGPDDPLFPRTHIERNADGLFAPIGLARAHWTNADAIRRIFRQSFEGAGLGYRNPHSLRKTLALLGERICPNPEAFKAWSQNLGHEQVLTTFTSYGAVSSHRQGEILERLRHASSGHGGRPGAPDAETIRRVLEHLSNTA
jgi:integrase